MTVSRTTSFLAGFALVGALGAAVVAGSPEGADICRPGFARSQRLSASAYYPIAEEAYRRAGIPWPERHTHILDHIRPLCLGGTWEQSNLQIQTTLAAAAKDRIEVATCRAYCEGLISMDEARSRFRRDHR